MAQKNEKYLTKEQKKEPPDYLKRSYVSVELEDKTDKELLIEALLEKYDK